VDRHCHTRLRSIQSSARVSTLETAQPRSLSAPRAQAWFNVRAAAPRVTAVVLYAVAMACAESAAVLYLRTIYGGVDPVGPRHSLFDPLPNFFWIEIGREAATMVMLATVGYLAGSTAVGRVGAFALAMGVWDIFYYIFLWVFAGWPRSAFAQDVLFLIPLPWWGPVLSPVLLAVLIGAAGTAAMARELGDGVPHLQFQALLAIVSGGALCLIAFMANSLDALPDGLAAAFSVRGGPFAWPIYILGLVVASVGLVRALTRAA
jgi:hypothetical protein